MDDVLSRNDLRDDEKAKRYLQLQNRYLAFKEKLSSRTRPKEINSAVPELPITQDPSTATVVSTPLYPFNVTPDLKRAAILGTSQNLSWRGGRGVEEKLFFIPNYFQTPTH